jgi:hypothetical protein
MWLRKKYTVIEINFLNSWVLNIKKQFIPFVYVAHYVDQRISPSEVSM